MSLATSVVSFGEWLPDLPALNHPGLLEADNVLPVEGSYTDFNPLSVDGNPYPNGTVPATPMSAFYAINAGGERLIVGSDGVLFGTSGLGWTTISGSATMSTGGNMWSFAMFDQYVIAVNQSNFPRQMIPSAGGVFTLMATTGTAPPARCVGVIGEFVVLGSIGSTVPNLHSIQWSAVNNMTHWPTPNSATAIATQSGLQVMPAAYGEVSAISGGDQFGLLFQESGITRMTYVGGSVVFQFDQIDYRRGAFYPQSVVKVDNKHYFAASDGFYVTDGVSVIPIGNSKVNEYFRNSVYPVNTVYDSKFKVIGAHDGERRLIYWCYVTINGSLPDRILIYNYNENRWSQATQNVNALFGSVVGASSAQRPMGGFTHAGTCGDFTATAGAARLVTGDMQLNPGGRAFVSGVKPNVESTGTAPAVTVRVGSRNDLGSTPTYTATTTPTTRTGYADCRVDAKYHRAEVQIVGNFTKAVGLEFDGDQSGRN